ncbi:MAG: hypothetical protein ACXIU5_19845 [Halomonadaceae bacterium]|jgi:hypothetical protein
MPVVTDIRYDAEVERYRIFVDGAYCTSVRQRTFPALGIELGQRIDCDEIKRREAFHWKHAYGEAAWKKEKVRIARVKAIIEARFSGLEVLVEGFGADSNDFIPEHPKEPGKPDLSIRGRQSGQIYCALEVSGTEVRRGTDYWVRPDKLSYAQNHPEQHVWICLHYARPSEKLVFIRPDPSQCYQPVPVQVGKAIEHYVLFDDDSRETGSLEDFYAFLLSQRPEHLLASRHEDPI